MHTIVRRHDHLTFKGNLARRRYGWLRLTPAYSFLLVEELIAEHARPRAQVLDPFCGTGTTALACAERGVACDTIDINPFLVWLAKAKTYPYTEDQVAEFRELAASVARSARRASAPRWLPDIHQIEKWWDTATVEGLGHMAAAIKGKDRDAAVVDLLKVAFCRTLIERANVSFGHQSMSFKKPPKVKAEDLFANLHDPLLESWRRAVQEIADAATSDIRKRPRVVLADARELVKTLGKDRYTFVLTSPPYPNRMSYIRELRPYMYWLGYLKDAREAGELDWKAIGGTWGCATSNVAKWRPEDGAVVPSPRFDATIAAIAKRSQLLSRYVEKYFHDIIEHCRELFQVVKPGGEVAYVVGNSKFYDVMLHVEEIYAHLLEDAGFAKAQVKTVRKRTSKKELFEFVVSARKPV
jgi:DNA modification methylase